MDEGFHNKDLEASRARLIQGSTYKDISTIIIIPTRGEISSRVVQAWFNMMTPMNQKVIRIFVSGKEVGEAYNETIEGIVENPELAKWKYILTLEDDIIPPPDGLLKLYEDMDKYDVVQGLYWTKGEGGQPMIYGNPADIPMNFIPQIPMIDALQPCNGLGMGFNLFKMKIFKDKRIEKPWFKTVQEYIPGVGSKLYTQDLFFYEKIKRLGYKVACDTRVKCGHYEKERDMVW